MVTMLVMVKKLFVPSLLTIGSLLKYAEVYKEIEAMTIRWGYRLHIDDYNESRCLQHFRFRKNHLVKLVEAMCIHTYIFYYMATWTKYIALTIIFDPRKQHCSSYSITLVAHVEYSLTWMTFLECVEVICLPFYRR